MSYRDDRDADQARIAALEAELAAAQDRVGELEGKRSLALLRTSGGALADTGKATTRAARWFGAPLRLELARTFEGSYPAEKFEALIDVIRAITKDRGRSELLRTSLGWTSSTPERAIGPFLAVDVSVKDGQTTLVVADRLNQLAGGIFGGLGGGLGGGGLVAPIAASFAMPVLAPVFVLGWFGGFYALTRTLYKRRAQKRAEIVQRLFDALAQAVAAAVV